MLVEGKNFLLDKKQLQPNVYYTAHVKAKLCPEEVYVGPWSEWSSSAEWRTAGGAEEEAIGRNTFYPPSWKQSVIIRCYSISVVVLYIILLYKCLFWSFIQTFQKQEMCLS